MTPNGREAFSILLREMVRSGLQGSHFRPNNQWPSGARAEERMAAEV